MSPDEEALVLERYIYTAVGDAEQVDAYGIMVLRIERSVIAEITGFGDGPLHGSSSCPAR